MSLDDNKKLQQVAEIASITLGDGAKQILEALLADSDKAFDHAMGMIKKTRETCDTAEQVVTTKRNDVRNAVTSYIETLQVTANVAGDAQKALGEVMLHAERLGG